MCVKSQFSTESAGVGFDQRFERIVILHFCGFPVGIYQKIAACPDFSDDAVNIRLAFINTRVTPIDGNNTENMLAVLLVASFDTAERIRITVTVPWIWRRNAACGRNVWLQIGQCTQIRV